MRNVVIVDYARSAFGKQGGVFRDLSGSQLGGFVIREMVRKNGIDPEEIEGVVMGSAYADLYTTSLARYTLQIAGLPEKTTGTTVEMQCGSGITSINHAAWEIAMGVQDVIIAGGCDSCSTAPAKFATSVQPYKMIPPQYIPTQMSPYPEKNISMIEISDRLAEKYGISREACDEFACRSQERLAAAYADALIGPEIIPYMYPATRKTPERIIDKDEHPRPDTTMAKLAKLRPVLEGGVTTAGNASGLNDGAAFVLMMSEEKAKELGQQPIARWVAGGHMGCEPELMGIGASRAVQKVLRMTGMHIHDMDVIECNEAFAAQNLACIKELEEVYGERIDQEKWNPNGGAIAIGHPNGASGARICIFAIRQLKKTRGRFGIFTSCCGGGQGASCLIENL